MELIVSIGLDSLNFYAKSLLVVAANSKNPTFFCQAFGGKIAGKRWMIVYNKCTTLLTIKLRAINLIYSNQMAPERSTIFLISISWLEVAQKAKHPENKEKHHH